MGAMNDGKHSMIRYYINNFTDGYNNDCLDLAQGYITANQKLNSRPFMSPMKIALIGLFSTLIITKLFLLENLFPHPDESLAAATSQADYDLAYFKTTILHALIFLGAFFAGALGIQHNGSLFVDDTSRNNL